MLQLSYTVGNVYLHRVKLWHCGKRANERLLYPMLKRKFTSQGWCYYRIENKLEGGMPDIMAVQNGVVLFMEVKYHKTQENKALTRIQKDLKWQRGQLAFMLSTIAHRVPYILCVYQMGEMAYYLGSKNESFTDTIHHCANLIERL